MPKKRKRFKKASKLLVVVGSFSLLMLSPIHHNDTLGKYMDSLTGRIEAQAAEADPFSPRWEIDGSGTWHYRLDNGGLATNCWVQDEVNGDWYLLDASGNMLSGVFESYGRYYLLDTVRGTGHYGRLLKNGQEFNGVIIQADTSAGYEGALSDATISALQGTGVSFTGVPGISGTQHVSNGVVTSAGSGSATNDSGSAANDTTSISSEDSSLDTANSVVVRGVTYHKPANVSQEDWDSADDDEKVLLSYGSTMESIRRMNELQRNTEYKDL